MWTVSSTAHNDFSRRLGNRLICRILTLTCFSSGQMTPIYAVVNHLQIIYFFFIRPLENIGELLSDKHCFREPIVKEIKTIVKLSSSTLRTISLQECLYSQ